MIELIRTEVPSPIGTIEVVENETGVCACDFTARTRELHARLERRYAGRTLAFREGGVHREAARRLRAYLRGQLDALADARLDPEGTEFQRKVWAALREIPAGRTVTYGELARRLGRPQAARAVGTANGANPIVLWIPCHRAVGANGALTGFASGLERKRWLLAHEGVSGARRSLVSDGAALRIE